MVKNHIDDFKTYWAIVVWLDFGGEGGWRLICLSFVSVQITGMGHHARHYFSHFDVLNVLPDPHLFPKH